jgi:hypothetical protein
MSSDAGTALRRRACLLVLVLASLLLAAALAAAAPALASSSWRLTTRAAPTQLPLEGKGFIDVQAINAGTTPIGVTGAAETVTVTDTLPEGMTATAVEPKREYGIKNEPEPGYIWSCTGIGTQVIKCTYNESKVTEAAEVHPVAPYESLELRINVAIKSSAGTVTNLATVAGGKETVEGGAIVAAQSYSSSLTVSGAPTSFGVEGGGYTVTPENEIGAPELAAGAHPFQLTTTVNLNETLETLEETHEFPAAPALAKDLHFNLPPGLLGNVTVVHQCTDAQFGTLNTQSVNQCPEDTAIGVSRVTLEEPVNAQLLTTTVPVFNLVPKYGEPARFGFVADHVPVVLDTRVRTGGAGGAGEGDYGVEVYVAEVTELAQLLGSEVSLWGTPGNPSHDDARGWGCLANGFWSEGTLPCGPAASNDEAFLTMPTSCASSLSTTIAGESWPFKAATEDGLGQSSSLADGYTFPTGFEGCSSLPFGPSIKLKPTESAGSTPTGLEVDVVVPQEATLKGSERAESDLRSTTVTLPEGVQLSPSAANGLEACSEGEIGYEGEGLTDPYSPSQATPEPMRFNSAKAECPNASKVGTVTVKTPLLKNELNGSVYLAAQDANPFHSTVALYIAAEDPESGVLVKIAGEVKLDPVTGRITSTFLNTPQVPFEEFIVDFNNGPRASVSTPPECGNYTTEASFVPWSTGVAQPSSSNPTEFAVSTGPGGGACSNPQPFAPGFTAGSTTLQAGGFTPFSLTITRPDPDQALKSVSVTLPPGAAAMLASATLCPEQQANEGTCGADSQIGEATATSGYGPDPYTVTGGRVYITGPYGGGPFGLSIVTPAIAGPFNLGNVVVRSAIFVDRDTAQVTINTTLPTIVQGVGRPSSGIPLQLQRINVLVNRPNFEFNPTNCTPTAVTGTLGGANGASTPVSSRFQVANCSALKFQPKLTAATLGNASKANGASLAVKIAASPGEANIAKTKLVIPSTLPSRLTTIQKACPDATFEKNPAACDEGSNIGTATVHTPVLKSPLTGPAYLVSHGNAAFPDVEFVLQGEGVTLILDGQTDIKKGVTTSTFNSVPDAPINTFETVLPEGPHSALTSNVAESKHFSLCGAKLVMPTTITGQNGVVITQQTNIPVGGCGAVKGLKESRSQKLAKALKKCRKRYKHSKKKRESCERKARKKFGAKKQAKKKASKKK